MVLVLALLGCVQRHEPFQSPRLRAVEVAPVLVAPDAAVLDSPERVDAALLDAMRARNLDPRLVPPDRYLSAFAQKRETSQRVAWLGGTDPLLLVEAQPRLFGLVRGHWKWVVEVKLTLAPAGLADALSVPVFLANPHDDADDALVAAGPEIARRAGELVDRWLEGS
ncbi:MAG: hypothetical protein ACOZNI_03430 [Myxococcota bacterium]